MKRLLALSCLAVLAACRSAGESSRPEAATATAAKPEVRYYVIADT